MSTNTEPAVIETALPLEPPIRIDCTLEGHKGEHVLYKRGGWLFRHYRLWEGASVDELIPLLLERTQGWELKDEQGEPIPYAPYLNEQRKQFNPEAMDRIPPALAAWLVGTFRMAYHQTALPSPKA
jgi:hypothetical protein